VGKWSKTGGLLLGTLALAAAFVWAYAGALHQPTPRDVPVGVVRGDGAAAELLSVVYFDRKAAGWPVTALAIWAAAGVGVLLAAAATRGRGLRHDSPV